MPDISMLIAVLLAPLLAVQASAVVDRIRARRDRRIDVFRTLIRTRLQRLSAPHVDALNLIDIEFAGVWPKLRSVRDSWHSYFDWLNQRPPATEAWEIERGTRFVELLSVMGHAVGYKLDRATIERITYSPEYHGSVEREGNEIRVGLANVLAGRAAIPMALVSVPALPPIPTPPQDATVPPLQSSSL